MLPPILSYLPGPSTESSAPLSRYLPILLQGVGSRWLAEKIGSPGSHDGWVLDPFGAAPQLAIEAARAGWRVLVAANNPVGRFLLEQQARPASHAALQSGLADLAASFRGGERLEPHIRALYLTPCAGCGRAIEAEAFLWERGASAPYARLYTCPYCNQSGEFPATAADAETAARLAGNSLHRARALERVAPTGDPDRPHVEEALEAYQPRALYALFTLINRLDGLALPPERRARLEAMLLTAGDAGNSLWAHPAGRERPRQLSLPPRFREQNLWLALERSVAQWASDQAALPLSIWPDQPPAGGICLFEGRLKELKSHLQDPAAPQISAVLTALPRPNQAFWTLSALWSGWLWGQEAALPFKMVLRRRRYDWAWHTAALQAALDHLADVLRPGTPFMALTGEAEPGLLTAAVTAAQAGNFQIQGLAVRAEQAQLHWISSIPDPSELPSLENKDSVQIASDAGQQLLRQYGQPAGYLRLHAAALMGLAQADGLPPQDLPPQDRYEQVQNCLQEALNFRHGFLRYGGKPEKTPEALESGRWWLQEPGATAEPLADRLEKSLVNHLLKRPGSSFSALEAAVCAELPGSLTPDTALLQVCLESYARQDPPDSGLWQIRPEDQPHIRRSNLDQIRSQLALLAQKLGYRQTGEQPLQWLNETGVAEWAFFPLASAVLGPLLLKERPLVPTGRAVIVLPGGRANLVLYKLRSDPRLRRIVEDEFTGWRFLKLRHLFWLAENPLATRLNLAELLDQDPLTYSEPQMRLF